MLAFLLSWLPPEVSLRTTTQAPDLGGAFDGARDHDALRELERALSVLGGREQRWQLDQRLAARAGIELAPPELWLLACLGERLPLTEPQLAEELHVDAYAIDGPVGHLRERSLIANGGSGTITLTPSGRAEYERLVEARCAGLRELLAGWEPDRQPEVGQMVDRLGPDLVAELPAPPSAGVA